MCRTVVNVTGDATVAVLVAGSEWELGDLGGGDSAPADLRLGDLVAEAQGCERIA